MTASMALMVRPPLDFCFRIAAGQRRVTMQCAVRVAGRMVCGCGSRRPAVPSWPHGTGYTLPGGWSARGRRHRPRRRCGRPGWPNRCRFLGSGFDIATGRAAWPRPGYAGRPHRRRRSSGAVLHGRCSRAWVNHPMPTRLSHHSPAAGGCRAGHATVCMTTCQYGTRADVGVA
jgi:hypothetical protein